MDSLILKGKVYDWLKWITTVVLPALGTAYFGLAGIWGLPNAEQIAATIVVVCTFLGIVLGISSINYQHNEARFDGTAYVNPASTDVNPDVLLKDPTKSKDEVLLKVEKLDSGEPDDPLPLP
jgi:hypothetical protein